MVLIENFIAGLFASPPTGIECKDEISFPGYERQQVSFVDGVLIGTLGFGDIPREQADKVKYMVLFTLSGTPLQVYQVD